MRIITDTQRGAAHRSGADPVPVYGAAEGGQKQVEKRGGDEEAGGDAAGKGPQKLAKKGEKLKDEMDALVDEIDEVLEENAEEFVKNYVQRGGE
jgi:prokaryotic ubiquitin-like protein Pup